MPDQSAVVQFLCPCCQAPLTLRLEMTGPTVKATVEAVRPSRHTTSSG